MIVLTDPRFQKVIHNIYQESESLNSFYKKNVSSMYILNYFLIYPEPMVKCICMF